MGAKTDEAESFWHSSGHPSVSKGGGEYNPKPTQERRSE